MPENLSFTYQIIRSARRTVAIQITPDGRVLVRCPRNMTDAYIKGFVSSKAAWVEKHLSKYAGQDISPFTQEALRALSCQAAQTIRQRVEHFAPIIGVDYGRIAIRHQRTRWGSCSAKGNLNFNCLLMLAPPEVADYVVVHELCHRKELNHSSRFWAEVVRVCPEYRACRKWLKENGPALIARLPF